MHYGPIVISSLKYNSLLGIVELTYQDSVCDEDGVIIFREDLGDMVFEILDTLYQRRKPSFFVSDLLRPTQACAVRLISCLVFLSPIFSLPSPLC